MSWYWIVLIGLGCYHLGHVNAIVQERDRFMIWMSNSWELMNRRLWWTELSPPVEEATMADVENVMTNMLHTITDYQEVFSRPYILEELLPNEQPGDLNEFLA